MQNIIVGTWGIGPSYRRRVKLSIEEAINSGYDNILPYIILTDQPEYFYELQDKTKKIIDIINIHDVREKYSPWSVDYEYISKEQTEEKYSEDYNKHRDIGKRFSYGMHRFYLPRISELGYNKFLHCDSDYWIRYDKIVDGSIKETDFWDEFNTPVNTMKGTGYTVYPFDNPWSQTMINFENIFRFEMKKRYPEYKHRLYYIFHEFVFTEGPFRYYHIQNKENVLKYFLLWDEITQINLTDSDLVRHSSGSTNVFLDYAIWMVVNEILGIRTINFPFGVHNLRIFWSDRYFDPPPLSHMLPDGRKIDIVPGTSREDFLIKNKELFDAFEKSNRFHDQFIG